MKGCVFITLPDGMYGFEMTGFQQVISDKDTILADLEKIVMSESSGLVFIDERLINHWGRDQ